MAVCALGSNSLAYAQSTGTLSGRVTDASGAVVTGAAIRATNTGTSEERSARTDSAGLYSLAALSTGTYRMEVRATGFQPVLVNNIAVAVGSTVSQDFTLAVGNTAETVEVQASAPVIQSDTVSISTVIDSRTVQEIPLNGRHFVDLGLLIPGSVTPPQSGFLTAPLRGQGSSSFNTAGAREDTVNFMINGVNLNDMSQNQITFQPSINTVDEFKVDNQTYSAEYGRNSGAIVNIATRAGTNQFHGEVFEFLRNNDLDARNYFNRVGTLQSPFKRNQFGAAAGGPIRKEKTFFFLSYEGLRQRQGLTLSQTVLTDAQRAQAAVIGNPTVQKLLPFIPAANTNGSIFSGSATAPVNIDQGTANINHHFSDKDSINGYYAYQLDLRQEPTLQGNNIPGFGDTREGHRQIFTFNETHLFSSSLVNEARLGVNRIAITFAPNFTQDPAAFGLNIGVSGPIGLPQITLRDTGLNFGGPSGFPQGRGDYTAVLSDTLSWTRGAHNLKFGGEFRRFNGNSFTQSAGTLAFNTVTDFLNGNIATFTANPSTNPSRVFISALGFFVQDTWKIRPSLTFELGMRYDWNGTPVEAANRFVEFVPSTMQLVRAGQQIDRVYKQNARNFEPRVGLAYKPLANGKMVIRAAYAIQTDQPVANLVSPLASNPPFSNPVSFSGPGFVNFGNAYTAAQAAGSLSPTTLNHDFRNSNVQSWNFNVQQDLPGEIGLMIGYFGNKGSNLRIARNLNQYIAGTTARPYPAISAASPISPGSGLGNITYYDSAGNSHYNALWITATKRMARGLQFQTSYTWSKSIDYNSLSSQGVVVQDSNNIAGDRGLSDFDARHRFVLSGIYELPFKRNLAVSGWQLSSVTQVQTGNPFTVVTSNSGLTGLANTVRPDLLSPVTVGLGSAPNGNPTWFQATACTAAAPGCSFLIANHLGNLGRGSLTGPGFTNVDISLLKNTRIRERFNVQFRADCFDVANHPNFGQPNRVASTASGNTFGQITSTRFAVGDSGSSRQLQLALKVIF